MPETGRPGPRRAAANALLLAGVVLSAAGVLAWADVESVETASVERAATQAGGPFSDYPGAGGGVAVEPPPATASPVPPAARPAPVLQAQQPGAPLRLVVPALGIAAQVDAVALQDNTMVPPTDPTRVGWWAGGSPAGSARGSTLIAGHTVQTGGGALDDLEEIDLGDRVYVLTDRGRLRYVVRTVRVLTKDELVDQAPRLFDQDAPRGRVVLLTCEDWNGSEYESNVVVTAVPRRR